MNYGWLDPLGKIHGSHTGAATFESTGIVMSLALFTKVENYKERGNKKL